MKCVRRFYEPYPYQYRTVIVATFRMYQFIVRYRLRRVYIRLFIVCGGISVGIVSGKGRKVPGMFIFVNSNLISLYIMIEVIV